MFYAGFLLSRKDTNQFIFAISTFVVPKHVEVHFLKPQAIVEAFVVLSTNMAHCLCSFYSVFFVKPPAM